VPTNFDVGSQQVPATRLLVRKLIEELVRFPQRRKQLLNQDVGQYVKIFAPFRSGSQYIVSEDLPAWSEMLRMDWLKKDDYKHIEEYSAISPIPEAAPEVPEAAPEVPEAAPEAPEAPEVPEAAPEAPEALEEAAPEDLEAQEDLEVDEEPIPSSEISFINTVFGGQFFFIPAKSVTDVLNNFGILDDDLEAVGQEIGKEITDVTVAENIASIMKFSIYQLIYSPGNPIPPKPLIVKLQSPDNNVSDVVVIVVLPDGRIGLVSSEKDPIPIPHMNLPFNIRLQIKKEKTVHPLE
jgi:hypothetical protein